MGQEIFADRSQEWLLPPSLEDWVPPEHPARFVADFVAAQDLKALGFKQPHATLGAPRYSNELLLGLWLYGYLQRVRTSRGIERACYGDVGFIWLAGMLKPDHNTLWRFFRDNEKAFTALFKQGVKTAAHLGLVGMALHALDGTKMEVASSKKRAWHKEHLERCLARLDEAIEEMTRQTHAAQHELSGEFVLPEPLRDATVRREEIKNALQALNAHEAKHHLPCEPEAALMKNDGRTQWSYNAQVLVDAQSGLIVAEHVTNAPTDHQQLIPMLEEVVDNLGGSADCTVADAGYHNGEQLARADQAGHTVLVNTPRDHKDADPDFHVTRFAYDPNTDTYTCPQGHPLRYLHTSSKGDGRQKARIYGDAPCQQCPMRARCTTAKQGRHLTHNPHHNALVAQRQRQEQPGNHEKLKKRGSTVERIFGWAKQGLGLRRFSRRGLDAAQAQWSLTCLVMNLKTLQRHGAQFTPPASNDRTARPARTAEFTRQTTPTPHLAALAA